MTVRLPDTPLDRLDAAAARETRADLLRQGEELLTRAGGQQLDPDASEDFRSIEQAVGHLDHIARARQSEVDRPDWLNRAVDAGARGDEPAPDPQRRALGQLPPIHFDDEALHGLHRGLLENRLTSVRASARETRAVTAVPMAGIPSYGTVAGFDREPSRIASLMPSQPVDHVQVTFYTQPTAASAAAPVAAGALKPESTPGWEAVTAPVRKLAHFSDVTTEALDDYQGFAALVRDEMVAGLVNVENSQVLSGTGLGENLLGLLNASGILTYAPAVAEARYRSLLRALTMLRTGPAYAAADAIVLHPDDWEIVVVTASQGSGEFLVTADPTRSPATTLWGVPVTVTSQIPAGTALVANMARGAVVFTREVPTVKVDPYSQSANNLVRFICEERLALGVTRPAALAAVTFNGTT